MLFGAFAFSAAAEETPGELQARGEALLRETLPLLTSGPFTIYHGPSSLLSYNGKMFALLSGADPVTLLGKDVYYEFYRILLTYVVHNPESKRATTQLLFAMVNLKMPEEVHVDESEEQSRLILVSFEQAGVAYVFSYRQDGRLYSIQLGSGDASSFRIAGIGEISQTAPQDLFNLLFKIRMPEKWFDRFGGLMMDTFPASLIFGYIFIAPWMAFAYWVQTLFGREITFG